VIIAGESTSIMTTIRGILLSILLAAGVAAPVRASGPPAAGRAGAREALAGGQTARTVQAYDAAGLPARWQQRAELTARDGVAGDHLGGPVALNGGLALVGAWDRDHGTGAAYVFVRHGSNWIEQARLTAGDGKPGDWFGVSVALSGATALVGAPLAGHTGAAYVFVRHGSRWIEQARLSAGDGAPRDWFGRTVALSGNTALVSAWYENNDTGVAYVFVRHGSRWIQQAKLTAVDGVAEDYFGSAVALRGDTALIGAAGKHDNTGAAYVFVRKGSHWAEQATLTMGGGKQGDTFGTSIALSGQTALVGAGFANHNMGAAYVFVREGSRWAEQAQLTARDGASGDWFGRTVALSGDTALLGAWYENNHIGAAYVFVRHGSRWTQQAKLTADDGVAQDYFGTAVALSGGTCLIGAGFKNHAAGAAYVFSDLPAA
jgi:hypothetical protein